jgi:nicotinamidase-related amidase
MPLSDLDPSSTAVLVIDMQNAFAHPEGTLGISGVDLSEIPAVSDAIEAIADAADAVGMPVLWTKQVHLTPDHGRAQKRLASHTSKRKRVSALAGSWDADFTDRFAAREMDETNIIVKHRFGAFYETRLESVMRMRGVTALIVVGATANACVDTTVREAYMRDIDVVVPVDAVAGVKPHWKQLVVETWAHYFGEVSDTASVVEWIRSAAVGEAAPATLATEIAAAE